MDLEPVPDVPALRMKGEGGWVVVADLHVGIEVQLRRSGFSIPSQMPKMMTSLEALAGRGADNLMILGDLKHRIPSVGHREDKEIRELLGRMLKVYRRVVLVAGNHDGGISSALPEGCEALSSRGTRIGKVGLFHGHVWPSEQVMEAQQVVMAHVHPAVLMVDSLGTRSTEKCWARARLAEERVKDRYDSCPGQLVIVPAFNPLLTGTPVNSDKGSMLGPFFNNGIVEMRSMKVHLLDGTYLDRPARLSKPRRE
ncbi:MAG TPA: phosphoesterase [Thermoplasmata archaeon]|nr:phosphoesterase [Thermoplasmata archaeon]